MNFEIPSLKSYLSSMETDWKIREESLLMILKKISTESEEKQTYELISTIPDCIALQFSDLRSGIVKLASEIVMSFSKCSRNYPEELAFCFCDKLLQESSFFKALGSGNKVISKHAHNALYSLSVNNCLPLEVLKKLFIAQRTNKINSIRENVAESFSIFLAGLTGPIKKQIPSIFYIANCANNDYSSPKIVIETPNLNKNEQPFSNNAQTGLENEADLTMLTQKIKEENFDFLKIVCETFLKDSSANVRTFGKEIKLSVSKIQELFLSGQETNFSQFSNELFEDIEGHEKFIASNDNGMVIESAFETQTLEKNSKATGLQSKQNQNKLITNEEKILRILMNESKTAKDQAEELDKVILSSLNCFVFSFEQFCQILASFNVAKNINLKGCLIKVFTKSDNTIFQFEILDFWLREKLHKRISHNQISKFITDRVSFEVLLSMMITRSYEDLVNLLIKNFCPKELFKILKKSTIEAQEISSSIQRNFMKADQMQLTNPTQYKLQIIQLLQMILADQPNADFFRNVEWSPVFLEKLGEMRARAENLSSNKFLGNSETFNNFFLGLNKKQQNTGPVFLQKSDTI